MGICFIGALAFTDDLNLLSPTLSRLKILIYVCEQGMKMLLASGVNVFIEDGCDMEVACCV